MMGTRGRIIVDKTHLLVVERSNLRLYYKYFYVEIKFVANKLLLRATRSAVLDQKHICHFKSSLQFTHFVTFLSQRKRTFS
jgi:hypothetical protein